MSSDTRAIFLGIIIGILIGMPGNVWAQVPGMEAITKAQNANVFSPLPPPRAPASAAVTVTTKDDGSVFSYGANGGAVCISGPCLTQQACSNIYTANHKILVDGRAACDQLSVADDIDVTTRPSMSACAEKVRGCETDPSNTEPICVKLHDQRALEDATKNLETVESKEKIAKTDAEQLQNDIAAMQAKHQSDQAQFTAKIQDLGQTLKDQLIGITEGIATEKNVTNGKVNELKAKIDDQNNAINSLNSTGAATNVLAAKNARDQVYNKCIAAGMDAANKGQAKRALSQATGTLNNASWGLNWFLSNGSVASGQSRDAAYGQNLAKWCASQPDVTTADQTLQMEKNLAESKRQDALRVANSAIKDLLNQITTTLKRQSDDEAAANVNSINLTQKIELQVQQTLAAQQVELSNFNQQYATKSQQYIAAAAAKNQIDLEDSNLTAQKNALQKRGVAGSSSSTLTQVNDITKPIFAAAAVEGTTNPDCAPTLNGKPNPAYINKIR